MGRPHTFAGGVIAWPFYKPYELYGRVDPVYSPEAYYSGLGWTGAQGLGNIFETLAYLAYLYIIVTYGRKEEHMGKGAFGFQKGVNTKRRVEGYWGAIASLTGYTTFMITVAKSVLYCKSRLSSPDWGGVVNPFCLQGTMTPSWGSQSSTITIGLTSSLSSRFPSKYNDFWTIGLATDIRILQLRMDIGTFISLVHLWC